MTLNRDTIAASAAVVAQAAIGVAGKHGWLTVDDVTILMGAVVAVLAAFHVPNAKAAEALAVAAPKEITAPLVPLSDQIAAAVATSAADPQPEPAPAG